MERHTYINSLINKFKLVNPQYLEIGVQSGSTFMHIQSTNKDGVDPGIYCDCSFVNYKMTSDQFFEINNKKYDLVFIDGLHTAYQVTKDIYNSLRFLNDGGIIVLDDVFPHSENEQLCLDLNRYGPLTGDVWKAVYHIFDTILEISDVVYFTERVDRGLLTFKVKPNNNKNIVIDASIPTTNLDGWHADKNGEWNLYTWTNDYQKYISKLYSLPSGLE